MSKTARARRRKHRSTMQKLLSSYWTWLGVGVALIVIGIFALNMNGSQSTAIAATNNVDPQAAPVFHLNTVTGDALSLSDYRGQYVLVNFWATWCPPCRAELPDLVSYYHAHADQGFMLIGVNEQEQAPTVQNFLAMQGLDFTVVLDSAGQAMDAYGVRGLPSSFLIDPEGRVIRNWSGMINRGVLESTITPLLETSG